MSATNLNTVTAELPQIPKPRELVDQRLALQANGYDPIPVLGAHLRATDAGKRPTMSGWQTSRNVDPEVIRGWSASQSDQADCTNTGILCGKIVGVDIDVLNIELSGKLSALAQEILGSSSLRRIGRAPKVLFCYRVETPHEKCSTQELFFGGDPTDKTAKAQVEILATGQQFVAFGIHPDTRQLSMVRQVATRRPRIRRATHHAGKAEAVRRRGRGRFTRRRRPNCK
jgi:putative DNA primase/helicase